MPDTPPLVRPEFGSRADLQLPSAPDSVAIGRAHVHDLLSAQSCPGVDVDVAVLLTSELVTNAVLHGRGPISLHAYLLPAWQQQAGGLRVEVRDHGDVSIPTVGPARSVTATDGRGLLIVDALATSWGSVAHRDVPYGTTVWFELTTLTAAVTATG